MVFRYHYGPMSLEGATPRTMIARVRAANNQPGPQDGDTCSCSGVRFPLRDVGVKPVVANHDCSVREGKPQCARKSEIIIRLCADRAFAGRTGTFCTDGTQHALLLLLLANHKRSCIPACGGWRSGRGADTVQLTPTSAGTSALPDRR